MSNKEDKQDNSFYLCAWRKNKTTGVKFRKKCLVETDKTLAARYDRNKIVEMSCARGVSFSMLCQMVTNTMNAKGYVADINDKPLPTDMSQMHSLLEEANKVFVENVPSAIRQQYNNDAFQFYNATKNYGEKEYYELFKQHFNPSTLTNAPQPITPQEVKDK